MKNFLTNWRTSGAAALMAILVLLNLFFPLVFTTDVNIKAVGAITALVAVFAADSKNTSDKADASK